MTDEEVRLREEQEASHQETLAILKETTKSVSTALDVLSEAKIRLLHATIVYEERLNGSAGHS